MIGHILECHSRRIRYVKLHTFHALPFIDPQMSGQMQIAPFGVEQQLTHAIFHSAEGNAAHPRPTLHENNTDMLFAHNIGANDAAIR